MVLWLWLPFVTHSHAEEILTDYVPSLNDAKIYKFGKIELYGVAYQGGWFKGKLPPKHRLKFLDKDIKIGKEGRFIIGIPYQSEPLITLIHIDDKNDARQYQLKIKQRKYKVQYINGLPQSKVTPSKKFAKRIKHEIKLAKNARSYVSDFTAFDTEFIRPSIGRITGRYGSSRVLNGLQRAPHWGLDFAAKRGTAIVAPASGLVRLVHPGMHFSGKTIMIDHGHGLFSSFLHLNKIYVNHGSWVERGQKIGTIGSTGRSTGPHLDWRISWLDQRIDAATFIPKE